MNERDLSAQPPSQLPFIPEPQRSLVPLRPLPVPEDEAFPGLTAIGPVQSERKARDWALVLQSQSKWHVIRRSYAGWILLVRDEDYEAARSSIDRYETENRDWPPRPTRERPRHASSPIVPLVFALMVAFYFVTGPAANHSFWFARGEAVSSLVLRHQPWRAVTALTLHADDLHVLGNAVSGTIFASAVQRRLGSGGALLAVLASGIAGNFANAAYHHGGDHISIGASTAIFGAVGLLAATELVLHRATAGRRRSWIDVIAPIVGGFALLGELGSGSGDGRTDLGAHLFGFLSGVIIGLAVAFPLRRSTHSVDLATGRAGHDVTLGAGAPRWRCRPRSARWRRPSSPSPGSSRSAADLPAFQAGALPARTAPPMIRLPPLPRPRPAAIIGAVGVISMIAIVVAPWLRDVHTFGFHDWDAETSHRYLALVSLLRYHELPGWNPYACGGFPAWGYVEADTILVSPFLPAYLFLPMPIALRVEVIGMALIGAAGAWLAASRYTESRAARALVVVLWATNGRWALQAASGHTWHLAYAFMPWCLYFFERARTQDRKLLDLAGGAVAIAMLVYAGGIYPLPHTVLFLGVLALIFAVQERSPRPITTLAAMGLLGAALAAPKLLPLLDGFGKAPRLIDSTETLSPGALIAVLTSRDQGFGSRPAPVSPYGWHEWGMYIGTAGALVLLLAVVFVQGKREAALKAAGVLFFVLGFGAFHPQAPWTLLHKYAPVFKSQHVPSRFLYTAVLAFALVAAAGIGRFITARRKTMPWLDPAAALLVALMGIDIGIVAQKPMLSAMWMVPPDHIPQNRAFHFEQEPPFQYKRRDWAGPMYLAMLGNTGVINCYGAPPFDRKGARPVSAPDYKGEAWVKGTGAAHVAEWSPNHAVIEVQNAEPGALLVYNMNFDEGWSTDAGPVVSQDNALAVRLPGGVTRVTFRYRPPWLWTGTLLAMLAIGGLVYLHRREQEAA